MKVKVKKAGSFLNQRGQAVEHPAGAIIDVTPEYGKRLIADGWADEPNPAKPRATSRKKKG